METMLAVASELPNVERQQQKAVVNSSFQSVQHLANVRV